MKLRSPLVVLSSWIALALAPIHAAEGGGANVSAQGQASVSGRVQNMVTGQYLHNARVSVKGTDIVTFTDSTGTYRLVNLPAGRVALEFYYTGLDPKEVELNVVRGQALDQNVELTSVARYGEDPEIVKLNPFLVSTTRDTDARSIAINEQRFAANIKNVVSTDAVGDVMDGNVGEFLKFMPGITAVYGDPGVVESISVRGFSSHLTVLTNDGATMANTSGTNGESRSFYFNQVAINNVARLEVTKVPTPAQPADSLAGIVNMVSKSAFEREGAELRYSFSLTGKSGQLDLGKSPLTFDDEKRTVRPSTTFDYTLPVTKNFGIVVTGQSINRLIDPRTTRLLYNTRVSNSATSISNPVAQTLRQNYGVRLTRRDSLGLRADWRVTPNSTLSASVQSSRYHQNNVPLELLFNVGTNGSPSPSSGVPLNWDADNTYGATGRGVIQALGTSGVFSKVRTNSGILNYRFDDGNWRIDAHLSQSLSKGGLQDTEIGRFRQIGYTNKSPVRINFLNIGDSAPATVKIFNNAGQEIDIHDVDNWVLMTANSTPRTVVDEVHSTGANVRKVLHNFAVPAAIQFGGTYRDQDRDVRDRTIQWTFNRPVTESLEPYINPTYGSQSHFGFTNMPWLSTTKLWNAFVADPTLFYQTPAQIVSAERTRIEGSFRIKEAVSALYLQGELGLLKNRLKLLAGVRYEKTDLEGDGLLYDPSAVYAKNPDGSFVHDGSGNRVRKPVAGASGSMGELLLTRTERGFHADRSYDGYYPSLHLTYHIRDNFLARLAYARSYGRPNFEEIVPNTEVNEMDDVENPGSTTGTIEVNNTGLKPWTANNYDFSLEYYTKQGGVFSIGAFRKDIKNFFGTLVKTATAADLEELGLEPGYLGWELSSTYNGGDAGIQGFEFNINHSLRPLGEWGRYFSGFVNGTKLKLKGDRDLDFNEYVPETMNWGLRFQRWRFDAMVKWNYRGKYTGNPVAAFGPDAMQYQKSFTSVDVNVRVQVRRNMFLFWNAQNLFEDTLIQERHGSETPKYAYRPQFLHEMGGVQMTLGVEGTF